MLVDRTKAPNAGIDPTMMAMLFSIMTAMDVHAWVQVVSSAGMVLPLGKSLRRKCKATQLAATALECKDNRLVMERTNGSWMRVRLTSVPFQKDLEAAGASRGPCAGATTQEVAG